MEGIVKGIIKLNPLTEIILLISVSIVIFTNISLKIDIFILVRTNSIRSIMYALKRIHLPESLIIPLAISIRYFPSLREERTLISDAIKIRGVTGFKKIKLGVMPLIVTASNTADELAQAITVRGIENPARKTFVDNARCSIWDGVLKGHQKQLPLKVQGPLPLSASSSLYLKWTFRCSKHP